jgi:hypothetical protein
MLNVRPFEELNLWQRIFADHWLNFVDWYENEQGGKIGDNWSENVSRMLSCGDIREGYHEYLCRDCGKTKKVGFTCKSKLCLRCFKTAVDEWLEQARKVLFEGVVHRQVVLTVPQCIRPLITAEPEFLKAYIDAGAKAVKELIEEWRKKKKIRVGIMAVLQLHGRSGNRNPHLHFIVSEGGIDKNGKWCEVKFFDTKKLRKKWQYHVVTELKKAVRGTPYEANWRNRLGALFGQYPTGFDCNCMPEEGPVERLVVYLLKYVSSPPISLRRIESYDGQNVTYRYDDHRRGTVVETIPATEFIGRMIQHLPPKGFRMVRYYGIYARPVREKFHALVADALAVLVRRAQQVAEFFARKYRYARFAQSREKSSTSAKLYDHFGKGELICPHCGSSNMVLIRTWSAKAGLLFEDIAEIHNAHKNASLSAKPPSPPVPVQLLFSF